MPIMMRLFAARLGVYLLSGLSDIQGQFRASNNRNVPVCLCGNILQWVHRSDGCYKKNEFTYVICDMCDEKLPPDQGVYHCRQAKTQKHPIGFDLCESCVKKHNYRLKRYHALIISPPVTVGNHNNQDGKALFDLFSKLNYHSVTLLSDNDANRDNILKVLDILNGAHHNDTVVICYSGHGSVNQETGGFVFYLDNNKYIHDIEFVSHLNMTRNGYSVTGSRDILLILHACYSGAFKGIKSVKPLPMQPEEKIQKTFNNDINIDEKKVVMDDLQRAAVHFLKLNDIKEYETDGVKAEEYVEKFFKRDWMSKQGRIKAVQELMRSMVVLASCRKQQETMFVGGLSPFVKYIIDAFLDFKDVDTEFDVTPKSLVEYIENQSKLNMLDQGYELDCILYGFQHTNIAEAKGLCAYDFSLKPVLKPYHKKNERPEQIQIPQDNSCIVQ
eukprot:462154_1